MREFISKDVKFQIALLIFLFFSSWWLFLQFNYQKEDLGYQFFGATYGLMALYGGINALIIAQKWGGWDSLMGKAIIFFAAGLLAQELGQLTYSYYTYFAQIEIPYPSVGDIGYFGSIPLYILGVLNLAKVSGVHVELRSFMSKLQALFLPLIMLTFSYFFFLKDYVIDWSQPLTLFLDFGYPSGQAIYISLAILTCLLTRNILGGKMRIKVLLILFALLIQYLADYMFLYQAHRGLVYAGGFNDFMYLVAYFIMTLSLLQFNSVFLSGKTK